MYIFIYINSSSQGRDNGCEGYFVVCAHPNSSYIYMHHKIYAHVYIHIHTYIYLHTDTYIYAYGYIYI